MDITTSNALIGISLFGGIAHMMLYMNGLWTTAFWITAIGVVLIPLAIKKQLRGRKISFSLTRNSKGTPKNEKNDLFAKIEGNCKICGQPLKEGGIDFCSQNCNFEYYLNSQSKNSQKEIEPDLFSNRPQFSYL